MQIKRMSAGSFKSEFVSTKVRRVRVICSSLGCLSFLIVYCFYECPRNTWMNLMKIKYNLGHSFLLFKQIEL